MASGQIQYRRKIRALEAKRDALLESKVKQTSELAKIRAELKAARKAGG